MRLFASPALTGLVLVVLLSSCGSDAKPKSYKQITCGEYAKLVSADDAPTNGALDIANDYLDALPIDPKGGASDVADLGDQIVSSCDTATEETKIVDLKGRVLSVFLAKHPQDAP